jgi:L-asparaginase/Glu-tRNA(Gln) amidotransferase subunit D
VRRGVRVWMDLAELAPGNNWEQRIEWALNQADAVVLVATRASVASQYVVDECKQAVACGVPVYVVLGQGCRLPRFLRAMTCYDARSRLAATIAILAQDLAGASVHARVRLGGFLGLGRSQAHCCGGVRDVA